MVRLIIACFVAVISLPLAAADVAAQGRTTGTGLGGGALGGAGTTGFGTGGIGAGSFGTGSFGGGLGGAGSRGGGTTAGFGNSGLSARSILGFGQQTPGFVGRTAADMQQFFESSGQGTGQFSQGVERATGGGRDRQTDQPESTGPPIRVKLRLGSDFPRTAPASVSRSVPAQLQQLLARRLDSMPQISVEGRTVTLRGTVASQYERLMVEKLARLEPGVDEVNNELVVAQ